MTEYSASQPVRVAFIGVGAVMGYHHLPGLRLDSRARLAAICDTNPELLQQRKEEWDVELATTDALELCQSDAIDAVVIGTPNDTHLPIAVAAAQAGKHIMCEKPLGLSAEEVRAMYEAARDAGVVHMTAFTYRFAPRCATCATSSNRGRWERPGISDRSGSSTGPKRAGDGASTRTRPAPATCST